MTTLTFYFRPSSRIGNHPGRLCLRITHKRQSKRLTLEEKIYALEWNKASRRLIYPTDTQSPRTKHLKKVEKQMITVCKTLKDIIDNLTEKGLYTLDEIMDRYHFEDNRGLLMEYTRQQAQILISNKQERTARAYLTVAQGLVNFNQGKDIPLKRINACLIRAFEDDLKQRGKSLNTISFYMRNLRVIYNKAIAEKYILEAKNKYPFKEVYTSVHKTRKRELGIDEIQRLNILDFNKNTLSEPKQKKNTGLHQAKRLFLFSFYARGMSFIDLAYLRKENINNGTITYYRKKTGGLIEVKITLAMQEIIDSFSAEMSHSGYLFPLINDSGKSHRLQYENALRLQNSRLKKLAAQAKLTPSSKGLSTDVARHSWSILAKRENLPLWVISEGLGHRNEKTTYMYLASLDQNVIDRTNDLITDMVT